MTARRARSHSEAAFASSPISHEGAGGQGGEGDVVRRLWSALEEIEDPEIPVSLVDMGLIVCLEYEPLRNEAKLKITYTAMGCPAMDMIQDDIRARLLRDPDVKSVAIEVVWDPVWTPRRLSQQARESMRELGLSV